MVMDEIDLRLIELLTSNARTSYAELAAAGLDALSNAAVALESWLVTPIDPAQALVLWLDAGSLELLSADGLTALTLQHRLQGTDLALRHSVAAGAKA